MSKHLPLNERIVKLAFKIAILILEKFYNMDVYLEKVDRLRELPCGTIGSEIAKCLDRENLRLVPKFESHDLKHVLLDYKMTPVDEIKMQAFMVGNGNYTIPSFAILIFGLLLIPNRLMDYIKAFSKGRKTKSISKWTINEFKDRDLEDLRAEISLSKTAILTGPNLLSIINICSIAFIVTGISGMIYCLPYLYSSSLENLLGAGFPFLAGAILASCGLISLSYSHNNKVNSDTTRISVVSSS